MNISKNLTIKEIFSLATKNHASNNIEVAQKLYKEVLKINPNYAPAHNNLGVVFKTLGETHKAKDCYEKSIEIDPSYADAYCNLGMIFKELEENQKAIDYYEKAIEINPKHLNAHNNLGGVYNKLGDYKRAIETYEKVIEIDSNHEITLYNLGVALHSTQQYKNAAEKFKLINFKNSKSFLLSSLYNLDDKSNFFKTFDDQIKQGEINAIIGSLISRSEIKYGVKKQNPFCEDPLKYSLKIDLTEKYNFKDIFVDPVKSFLKQNYH